MLWNDILLWIRLVIELSSLPGRAGVPSRHIITQNHVLWFCPCAESIFGKWQGNLSQTYSSKSNLTVGDGTVPLHTSWWASDFCGGFIPGLLPFTLLDMQACLKLLPAILPARMFERIMLFMIREFRSSHKNREWRRDFYFRCLK